MSARLAKRSTAGRAHAARGGKSKSAAPSRKAGDTPNGFSLRDMQAAVALATSRMRARFDAAETTDDNRKHWAPADGLSADMAASPGVRRILRNRCRYEVANNTYAFGMADTLANDCVGTGPRLQLTGLDRKAARYIEREFKKWSKAVGLAEKLRTMRRARVVDGEAFGLFINNPQLSTRVRLDIRLLEAEQCASSAAALPLPQSVDGIRYDAAGNASVYEILPEHPGGRAYTTLLPIAVDASKVLHFFVAQRPGQRRGIPELTPALPLFAQLRRWTLSVLAAAETAADLAGIIQTQGAPEGGEVEAAAAFERVEFERRALMTLPEGYAVSQLKAEQPTSTYKEVKREILNEIARSVQVPFNVAAGNSADYNYSSGRLDFQIYERAVMIDRERMETQILERVFAEWVREAVLIEDYLPQPLRLTSTDWSHAWYWPGFAHIDPKNEAEAQEVRLRTKTTTLADEWAREGEDWEEKLEAIARIEQRQRELAIQYGNAVMEDPVQFLTAAAGILAQVKAGAVDPESARTVLGMAFPSYVARIATLFPVAGVQPQPQPQSAAA